MTAAQVNPSERSVTNYLNALVWDGTPRLDRWLVDCAGAEDTPHVRGASRTMLVAAVRRARDPGCRCDQMPVLEGPSGCGKSLALLVLAVEEPWFAAVLPTDLTDGDARKIIEATQGKWIVEVDDLAGMKASESSVLKSFLSRATDEARLVYQRDQTRVPRQFVVFGTTSTSRRGSPTPDYLQDTTGHRRFWPVTVERFDLALLAKIRDQLWAEAAIAEAAGEAIDFTAAAA